MTCKRSLSWFKNWSHYKNKVKRYMYHCQWKKIYAKVQIKWWKIIISNRTPINFTCSPNSMKWTNFVLAFKTKKDIPLALTQPSYDNMMVKSYLIKFAFYIAIFICRINVFFYRLIKSTSYIEANVFLINHSISFLPSPVILIFIIWLFYLNTHMHDGIWCACFE